MSRSSPGPILFTFLREFTLDPNLPSVQAVDLLLARHLPLSYPQWLVAVSRLFVILVSWSLVFSVAFDAKS